MQSLTKLVFLDPQGEKFFGEGPCRLLHLVEETGSLRAAAQSMGMAYTKALKILKNAESALGFALTERTIGGRHGGGSHLTAEGRAFLSRFEACRDACRAANETLFREYFPQAGCVIMASGMGTRFGGNKLMADFGGKPMILRTLRATEGLFAARVVVTRHADVAEICRAAGAEVILHDLPLRSDTVRLGTGRMLGMDGCMFCQADQPLLRRATVAAMLNAWRGDQDFILRAACSGAAGSPVLFPRWAFDELQTLPEGKGGGALMKKYPQRVRTFEVQSPWEMKDADTPEALTELLARAAEGDLT